jgi:hypothetical protein
MDYDRRTKGSTMKRWWQVVAATALRLAAAPLVVTDLDGEPFDLLGGRPSAATVLVFAAVDCPISNRYAPELQRLHADYAPRGVSFFLVYPAPGLDAAAARRHVADYGIPFPALLDPEHRLVEHTRVEVTPEAAVLAGDGTVGYRGRIDDRWVALGKHRPQATRHDLREALDAILAGRPAGKPGGRAVGCYIEPLPRDRGD